MRGRGRGTSSGGTSGPRWAPLFQVCWVRPSSTNIRSWGAGVWRELKRLWHVALTPAHDLQGAASVSEPDRQGGGLKHTPTDGRAPDGSMRWLDGETGVAARRRVVVYNSEMRGTAAMHVPLWISPLPETAIGRISVEG